MRTKELFAIGFAALTGAAAALFFVGLKRSKTEAGDTPSHAAPQLDIKNPGDQSEFPAAPQGERDLG